MENYKLFQCIGEGSFGEVFKAQSISSLHNFAIKLVRLSGNSKKNNTLKLFLIILCGKLEHCNI